MIEFESLHLRQRAAGPNSSLGSAVFFYPCGSTVSCIFFAASLHRVPRYADAYSRLFSFAFFTRVDAAFFKKYRLHIVSISRSKISQKFKPTLMGWVSLLINLFFRLLAAFSRISVFLMTCAAEKLLVSENRLTSGFQERVGGIGGSRVQSENPLDFRRAAFPPREGRLCRHSHPPLFGEL